MLNQALRITIITYLSRNFFVASIVPNYHSNNSDGH